MANGQGIADTSGVPHQENRMRWLLLLVFVVACEGPMGPSGGTQTLTLTGTVPMTGGVAVIELPADAGTMSHLPMVACYLSTMVYDEVAWVRVGDGSAGADPSCVLTAGIGAALRITLYGAAPGQGYSIVVVY